MRSKTTSETPPDIGPRYTLRHMVGEGAFGAVWRASDNETHRDVAIKLIHRSSPDTARRFDVEVRALERIDHPNCVRPFDAGITSSGEPYLVTEFVEGVTLQEWLGTPRKLEEKLNVATQIAEGLSAAHREGIIHRDLKPANVLIGAGDGKPKIVDFGIAKLSGRVQPDITKTGEVLGTPGFMSPEQLRGTRDVGAATDMYAYGALLFEMLEGKPPFTGDSPLELAMNHLRQPPPPLRASPPALAALTLELLDKDPARRPTAVAVVRRLRPEGAAAPATGPLPVKSYVGIALSLIALLILGLVAATVLQTEPKADATPPLSRSNPLAASSEPPNAAPDVSIVNTADLGRTVDDLGPAACPELGDLTAGRHAAPSLGEGAYILLPEGYTPRRRYPLVVFFHDFYQEPETGLRNIDLEVPATRDFVFLAPFGDPNDSHRQQWRASELEDDVDQAISRLADRVCIDTERLFLLGHGRGGHGASRMVCEARFVAVANFGYRHKDEALPCEQGVPELLIFPTEDPTAPANGDRGCNNAKSISIEAQISAARRRNDCSGEPVAVDEHCFRHSCRTPLTHCEVPGGRRWSADYNTIAQIAFAAGRCPRLAPTSFPVTRMVLEFFDEVAAEEEP